MSRLIGAPARLVASRRNDRPARDGHFLSRENNDRTVLTIGRREGEACYRLWFWFRFWGRC